MASGELTAVDSIAGVDSSAKVYNFEVADWHNYFVASSGALVHNTCPAETLYTLVAKKDDWYDFHSWGSRKPTGATYLKKGETWKVGTSKNGAKRYSQAYLNRKGVRMVVEHVAPKASREVRNLEKVMIRQYRKRYGELPAGNKMVR